MKIGISGYEAVISRIGYDKNSKLPIRVGSGEYVFQLLQNLHKIDQNNEYFIYLPCEKTSDMPSESSHWHYRVVRPSRMWNVFSLPIHLFINNPGLSVFLSPTHYGPLLLPFPLIISIMDLSYLFFTKNFKRRDLWQLLLWTKYSVKIARRIITISNATKNDILKEYGPASKNVIVTYPGVKKVLNSECNMENTAIKFNLNKDYILFVGTIQPRKNIKRLIEAFAKVIKKDKFRDLQLIIVGKPGWMYEMIYETPKVLGINEKVKFLSDVSDEDLPAFYKNALCFILPSLYEGFGLPVLEAMKYGCPVITSNVSSLPEAGGDAALYVNPSDTDNIASQIELVLNNKNIRENMIKKGYEQINKFSWEKTARETLKVFESLVKEK